MDPERFFTLGAGAPFEVNDIFTNREQYVAAFRARLAALESRHWAAEDLMNFRRPAANLMALSGEGGIGKSSLLRHLLELPTERESRRSDRRARLVVDFADPGNRNIETVLLRVRAALGHLGRIWPAFDYAFSLYWERKHPGESLVSYVRSAGWADRLPDGSRISDQITGSLNDITGSCGAIGAGYRILSWSVESATRSARLRRLRRALPAFELLTNETDPDRILPHLPVLLAFDLERHRAHHFCDAVVAFDTFEVVQALPPERGGLEDTIARLVYLLPNVYVVLASRLPLRWHDPVRSVGLTYGGTQHWPTLAGYAGISDQFPLDGLDDLSADRYLRARLTNREEPAIPRPVRERIVEAGGGSPHYLELSAALFESMAARGEEPRPEHFGAPFPEMVLRTMRDLPSAQRDLLRAAVLLEAFDEEILAVALPNSRGRDREALLERRFVRHDPMVWPSYRIHENLRRAVLACDGYTPDGWTNQERAAHVERLLDFLAAQVCEVWRGDGREEDTAVDHRRVATAFLLSLHAAAEHRVIPPELGLMAYTLRQLGLSQVLGSLPVPDAGVSPVLAGLTAVARLGARSDLRAEERYRRMLAATRALPPGQHSRYAQLELGYQAWWVEPEAAEGYFAAAATGSDGIAASAMFSLANNALRKSRFDEVESRLGRVGPSRLAAIRADDLRGHLFLHNGMFEQAAEQFSRVLDMAEAHGVPLFTGRAHRHVALSCMWFDPERTLRMMPTVWEANLTLDSGIGLFQCEMASALARALLGEWQDAVLHLERARQRLDQVGAEYEMLPLEPVRVLLDLARGREGEARSAVERMVTRQAEGRPVGPPSWTAVAAWWVGRCSWAPFDDIPWLDPEDARSRWQMPLERLRTQPSV